MTNEELDDIVSDLRDEAKTAAANDGDYYADQFTYHGCGVAADAIEWLRGEAEIARLRLEAAHAEIARLRLTDAEREAVEDGIRCCEYMAAYRPIGSRANLVASAAALRGLLEKHNRGEQ